MWSELLLWSSLGASPASAGACCAGAMTTIPARVGECEHAAFAATAGGELALARWDAAGHVKAPSPDEQALTASLAGAVRVSRSLQFGVLVPGRYAVRRAGDLVDDGGGIGDLVVSGVWDPVDESTRPVPVLAVGLRAPTGRPWDASRSPLLVDVTGLKGPDLRVGLTAERALSRTPWWMGVDLTAGPEVPVAWGLSAAVGRAWTSDWSGQVGVRASGTLAGEGTRKTTVSAQLVRGERLSWRAYTAVAADVAAPWFGREQVAEGRVTIGFIRVQ